MTQAELYRVLDWADKKLAGGLSPLGLGINTRSSARPSRRSSRAYRPRKWRVYLKRKHVRMAVSD